MQNSALKQYTFVGNYPTSREHRKQRDLLIFRNKKDERERNNKIKKSKNL